jgi:hypothetical protein
MKNLIPTLALVALTGAAQAAVTLVPNGDFSAGGTGWAEINGGGTTYSYPDSGGNPDGHGVMMNTTGVWGIWVANGNSPIPLASLGLTAGQTYTFVQDMKILSGANIGGLKVDFSGGPGGSTGDLFPASGSGVWATYAFSVTIPAGVTGILVVPLRGANSEVGYDNIGVITSLPLSVAITSPTNSQVVYSNFTINATASVLPGSITNVVFFEGASQLGKDTTSPFSYDVVGLAAGAHALKAVAWDNFGNTATSSVVNVTVTNAPVPAFSAYEPFNYALGTFPNNTLATGTGFAGNWTVANTPSIVAGLTYPNLPTTANAYQHAATGSRSSVNFSSVLSSGTKYVSFLFKGSGNSGADTVGLFLKSDNATSLFAGFRTPFSAAQTGFGLGSVNSTSLSGATALGSAVNISNSDTNLIVLRIDFNTSGANDTVSLWVNPPAGTNDPVVAPNVTYSAYDVGNISGFGFNIQGGYSPKCDEFRAASTYGEVVGATVAPPAPTKPTTLALAPAIGKQVSWTAYSTNSYQVQKSADNITWTNLGGPIAGTSTTSVYDTAFLPYYQVLETTFGGPGSDDLVNGSFETPDANSSGAANWASSPNTAHESVWVTNQWGSLTPVAGANLMFMQGTTADTTPTAPNAYLLSDLFPVTGGLAYNLRFSAANPVKVGGANPQYRVQWFTAGNAFISESWGSFTSAGDTWTQFSITNSAPVNAAKMNVFFMQAVGAGASWNWVTLIDDVTVHSTTTLGSVNVLTPVVKSGASFTATVMTNGVTATAASGTVTFKTNSVQLSANGLSVGVANSDPGLLLPPYTVTAIYSGDAAHIGSTNTLTVGTAQVAVTLGDLNQTYDGTPKSATATTLPAGFTVAFTYDGIVFPPTAVGTYQVIGSVVDADYYGSATNTFVIESNLSTTPTNITMSVSGGLLTLSWPASHLGWILQSQTNSLSVGISTNWVDVPGSEWSTEAYIPVEPAVPAAFYRLRYP